MGELQVLVFNQLSAAIRRDSAIAHAGKEHLKWDILTDQIIARVAEKIVGTFNQQYEKYWSLVAMRFCATWQLHERDWRD